MSRRIKLVVAYDGTDFCGWAANAGQRTVQGTLTEAVRRISGEDCEIVGASRTDSGAHALGQVCHFDTSVPVPTSEWDRILNRILVEDLRVMKASEVSGIFHSRFCAQARIYRYRIAIGKSDPFQLRFAHHWGHPLDVHAMHLAAQNLLGCHDFRAYTHNLHPEVTNTTRTLNEIRVSQVDNEIRIDISGTAFLRGMIRRISGALLEVGRGQRPEHDIGALLGRDRNLIHGPEVLPAKGLTLMRITYGRHPKDHRTVLQDTD